MFQIKITSSTFSVFKCFLSSYSAAIPDVQPKLRWRDSRGSKVEGKQKLFSLQSMIPSDAGAR
ncbi:hypothetical protein INR49_021865 [Caranx melampygus]|nr:hypothetical protein INR49_021865 [Caranx melampygus]